MNDASSEEADGRSLPRPRRGGTVTVHRVRAAGAALLGLVSLLVGACAPGLSPTPAVDDDLRVHPAVLTVEGAVGDPAPEPLRITVLNAGRTGRAFRVTTVGEWLEVTPTRGTLAAGEAAVLRAEAPACFASGSVAASIVVVPAGEDGAAVPDGQTVVVRRICSSPEAGGRATGSATSVGPAAPIATLAAAGDVACDPDSDAFEGTASACRMADTADVVAASDPDVVLVLGDAQYPDGALEAFQRSYEPTWGRFLPITLPVPGNHEYRTDGAAGYFAYFGDRAGDPERGYYAEAVGSWRLIALNSNCGHVGGCGEDSQQARWLAAELAGSDAVCTLAFLHHPRFGSGPYRSNRELDALWRILANAGADVLLAGHAHQYERFAPMDASGAPDPAGLRLLVVGTGGKSLYPFLRPHPASVRRIAGRFGVLAMELHEGWYAWRFLPANGGEPLDAGRGSCS